MILGHILATLRNRVEAQWQLDEPTSFVWRLRARPQLEWEFALSEQAGTSLTPFANVEFIWTTSRDMWAQFRMQAGLQLGVNWFAKGQVIEVNASVFTNLQPSRSYFPVVGAVWYQYLLTSGGEQGPAESISPPPCCSPPCTSSRLGESRRC